MANKLTRSGLTWAAAGSLVAVGLIPAPAIAAVGDVTISPSTGGTWTVFNTDRFSFTNEISGLLPADVEDGKLSYSITNPDQIGLAIDFGTGGSDNDTVDLTGYTSTGVAVAVATDLVIVDELATSGQLTDGGDKNGAFVVDFLHHNIVRLVISGMPSGLTDKSNTVTIRVTDTSAAGDATVGLTNTQNTGLVTLGYGYRDDVAITLQAWLENDGLANTIESDFASTAETIRFVDPAGVSVISEIVRSVGTGQNIGGTGNETKVHLNTTATADEYLTANLRFSRTDINLNQVDLTKWNYGVTSSETTDNIAVAANAITLRPASTAWAQTNMDIEVITPVGFTASNYNRYGNLLIRGAVTGDALAANKTYQMIFRHGADTAPFNDFISPAFTTVTNAVAASAVKVTTTVTSTTDATPITVSSNVGSTTLRAGTKAFTYRAQARETNGTTAVATANIPMVAVVTAGAFLPTGESISVSGSTVAITRANQAVVVAGLTDADGRYNVTVTSTTAAALQNYTVRFYIADGTVANAGQFVADADTISATYAAPTATTVTATPAIAASSDVTLKVAVTDQFGTPISTRGAAALNVELRAPTRTNLDQYAPVVNGEATFTFKNWLKTGESDILTARVATGTSTSPVYLSGLGTNVSLFAPAPVAAINVAPEVTGVVVNYVDFITGKTSTAKPGPSAGSTTYTGTVVNSNGAGIPGAAVTISGKGFQFKSGTDFTIDSVTLTTNAAGTFTVDMWTTVASATGNRLTVTSGDKTASTLIKSVLPTQLSTANLSFSWNVPATLVMNTTYAVTATVADKWGNPVVGANVQFSAFGSAQFNGVNAATDRLTDRTGKATAFLRSFLNVDGPAAIGATLTSVPGTTPSPALSAVLTDVVTTAWDESKWTNVIESQVNFLKSGSGAATGTGVVNVGSFNGKLVVYAQNLDGKRISWKVGGNWGKATAVGNTLNRFDRPTPRRGVTVSVQIYVDGVLTLTKSVVTR